MTEQLPDLVTRLRVDESDLRGAIGRAAGIGGAIGGALGSFAGGALSAAGQKLREFTFGAVDTFARVEDATAAAGVLFGRGLTQVRDYAAGAAETAGISKGAALDAALTFGTMGKAAGLHGKSLATFGTDFTQLAGDMASFRGTSPEQAIEAIGAALRGETEPIRQYGVLLDDASLRNEAMKQGLIKTTKEALTPQQKVLAAQALILKQTSDAQGDFARTSDSTANVQKRLAAESENAQAALGEKLAPAITRVREVMLRVVEYIGTTLVPKLQSIYEDVQPTLRQLGDAVQTAFGFFRQHEGTVKALTAAMVALLAVTKLHTAFLAVQAAGGLLTYLANTRLVQAATRTWAAVQWVLNAALTANPIGLVVVAVGLLVAAIVIAWKRSETFRDVVTRAMNAVQRGAGEAVGFLIDGFRRLLNVWLTVADGIISGAAAALGWIPGLGGKLKKANEAFDRMRDGIDRTLRDAAAKARGWGNEVANGLAVGISQNSYKAVAAAGDMANKVKANASHLLGVASPSKVFIAIGEAVGDGFVQGLVGTEQDVTSTLDNLLELVTDAGKKIPEKVEAALRDTVAAGRRQLLRLAREAEQTRQSFDSIYQSNAAVDLTQLGAREDQPITPGAITEDLAARVAQAQQFAVDLAALARQGLSDQAIADLSQRGAEAAGATATALLAGGQATIDAVNRSMTQLHAAGVRTAQVGSAAFYDAGVQTARGLAAGFESQQDVIDKAMRRVARAMRRAIRKELGLASPSKVFAEIGRLTAAGMEVGVRAGTPGVLAATRQLAAVPSVAGAQAAGYGAVPAGAAAGGAGTHLHLHGTFRDAQEAARAGVDELGWHAMLEGAVAS